MAPRVAEGQTAPPDAIKDAETWKEILKTKDAELHDGSRYPTTGRTTNGVGMG